jgi:hypothetical protein
LQGVRFEVLTVVALKSTAPVFWDEIMYFSRSSGIFWRTIVPPTSGSKSKSVKKPAALRFAGFLLGLLFDHEGGVCVPPKCQ